MPRLKFKITCNAIVSVKDGVDPVKFIKEENDFMAEPRTSNGCVVTLTPESVERIEVAKRKCVSSQSELDKACDSISDDLGESMDRYMHFSFMGSMFCVDTVDRKVTSTKKGKIEEMCGPKTDGTWLMNVETSN